MAFDPFGGLFSGGFGGIFGMFEAMIWVALVGVPVMAAILGFFYWIHKKRKWNLDVEFKLPRSDGRLINAEWGKGHYNLKRGVVFLKRKRKKKIPMKPFNVGKFLQGQKILTVIQVGPEDYKPVLNNSWIEMEQDKPLRDEQGKLIRDKDNKIIYPRAALLRMRVDTSESKAWKNSFERDSKSTYSIMSLLSQYAVPISIGLIIVLWGIQFIVIYTRVK